MLRISKLTDYAILVMVELTASRDEVLSAQALAERCGLEAPTVSKVLKALSRAALVESFRGPSGGYRARNAPAEISVSQAPDAVACSCTSRLAAATYISTPSATVRPFSTAAADSRSPASSSR